MARLLPDADPAQIELDPERRVAEALCQQLSGDVVIFHSYPWLRPERDLVRPNQPTVLREGEADFVVVHPRYGFLVVEVKGGHLTFDPASQRWSRAGGSHEVKDPFLQVARNMRALEEQLKQRSFGAHVDLPFSRARCVVLPHCDYRGTLPAGAHASMLFTAADLPHLGRKIEELFALQPFVPKARLARPVLDGITRALTSTFQTVPALWSEVLDQERRIIRFTEDQVRLLQVLGSQPRASIQGVAGSGKTVLAIAKARTFADQGLRVLFLCFNEMLAKWQNARLPEQYRNTVSIYHYHKLCSEWAKLAGLSWPRRLNDETFFQVEAPALLETAIDLLPDRRFDAVVVDEGQDFEPAWWDTVELINQRPLEGPLYIFFDPEQLIFQQSLAAMPHLGPLFTLPTNCRNTERIASHCGTILGKQISVCHGAPEGRAPVIVSAPTRERQRQEAEKQLKEWTAPRTGLQRQQIAIVTRGRPQGSSLARLGSLCGHPLTEDLERWQSGEAILLTNVHRFKGLEADALLLVDIPSLDEMSQSVGFGARHFYVACSRAKHLLTILHT